MQATETRIAQCDAAWKAVIATEDAATRLHDSDFSTITTPVRTTFYNDYNDMDADTIAAMHFGRAHVPPVAAHAKPRGGRRGSGSKGGGATEARLQILEREVAKCKDQQHRLQQKVLAVTRR
eukprot:jgi/Tetstr1/441973/TSEL_030178.t1